MSSVWIVTSGSYSEYHIDAVFTTEAGAEAYAAWLNGPECKFPSAGVEEWELDHPVPSTGCYVAQWCDLNPVDAVSVEWYPEKTVQPAAVNVGGNGRRYYSGYGPTREHARRAVSELYRAVKAGTFILPEAT